MTDQDVSFGRCVSQGWEAFQTQAGLAILGTLLYMVLSGVASQVPGGSILAIYPLVGGLYLIYIGIVKRLNPEISTLFAGFGSTQQWVRWLGVGWLLCLYEMLAFLACVVPGAIFAGPGIAVLVCAHCPVGGWLLIVLGSLVTIFAYYAIAVRWIFVFYAAAEGATAFDAIKVSTELTEGLRPRLFWIMIGLGLINLAGTLLCLIGTVVTIPVTECAICSLYLDVKRLKAQQAQPREWREQQ